MLHQCADAVVHLRHPGFLKTVVRLAVLHRRLFLREELQTCIRVVLCQTKNGLPSLFALFAQHLDRIPASHKLDILVQRPRGGGMPHRMVTISMPASALRTTGAG